MSAINCGTINCIGVVFNADCIGIVAINCTNKQFDNSQNNMVFVNNSFVSPKTSANASNSAPTNVDGSKGLYYCDASGGTVTINLGNPVLFLDCEIYFLRIDSSVNAVTFNGFGSENLNFVGLPQNLIASQGKCICLTNNGTDWFIKTSK